MFKVVSQNTFTREVTVRSPSDGGHVDETVKVTYNYLDVDQINAFDRNTPAGTADFLRAAVRKLDDLVGPDGRPLVFNNQVRDQVINHVAARQALLIGFFEAIGEARLGN